MLDRLVTIKVVLDHRDRLLDGREQPTRANRHVLGSESGGVRLDVGEHALADVGVSQRASELQERRPKHRSHRGHRGTPIHVRYPLSRLVRERRYRASGRAT
jgi:hypothetical protein